MNNGWHTALKIHVSEACKQFLDRLGGYILKERGLTFIKVRAPFFSCDSGSHLTVVVVLFQGKGMMKTYWLMGKSRPSQEHRRDLLTVCQTSQQNNRLLSPSQQTRVACVRPYTFLSAGQLVEGRCPAILVPAGESMDKKTGPEHKIITRTLSLGEESAKIRRRTKTYVAKQSDLTSVDDDDDFDECEDHYNLNDRLAEINRGVKRRRREIMICTEVQGYSWTDLWHGLRRGTSLKVRDEHPVDSRSSVPDYFWAE